MFSLSYLPTAERLTVVIVKARNLKFPQGRESGDPFVKVSARCTVVSVKDRNFRFPQDRKSGNPFSRYVKEAHW
jgi:hypothetical protein